MAYWVFLGAIGYAAFFTLRFSIDFNAGAPIEQSRSTIESRTIDLTNELGFSADSLHLLTTRSQHLSYYEALKDSLDDALPSPGVLNRRGLFLHSWVTTIGSKLDDQDAFTLTPKELFDNAGILQLRYDNDGRVRRLREHSSNKNPTFVAGDSLSAIASSIVGDIFNYELRHYRLQSVDIRDTVLTSVEPESAAQQLDFSESSIGYNTVFNWEKENEVYAGPELLTLEIQPKIKELESTYGTSIKYGASVVEFSARNAGEPIEISRATGIDNISFIIFFISVGLLVGLVFFKGIRHISKGQVEWKRALFVFVTLALALFGWRVLYLLSTYEPFLSGSSLMVVLLNFLLFGLVTGLYGALAYIGWEATSRGENNDKQLPLIDAFWRNRFFLKETGDGLIRGYALAGILLGLLTLVLYVLNLTYYQHDSQFGFSEPSITPKLLSINIATWSNAWLVVLGHIGVTAGFLRSKMRSRVLYYPVACLIVGFLFAGSAAMFAVEGSVWFDLLLFVLMAPILLYAFEETGLLTVSFGWWMFTTVLLIMPYLGSQSLDVAYIGWVEGLIVSIPLIFGFISYRYGKTVSEIGGYIPEYQERMKNQLRVEKEIEIARESQFKLMPLQPPSISEVDVYGFFLPSFEVGGDYFDYVVGNNGTAGSRALTMTIVDVSGKAMKAAMHAVFTSGLLLSRLHRDQPADILREVAPTIYHRTDPKTFITCIIARYDPADRSLQIANAGHCLPVLKRQGKADFIYTPAPKYPLGVRDRVAYEALQTELQPGDFILLYSDGLPEAVDPEGNRFGFETVLELVESIDTDTKTCNEIALEIKRRIQKFSDYQLVDDTTIICLKV